MSIIRLIHIKVDRSETANAVRIWKTQCASLMIQQKGCLSEKLLRCRDAPEFISYSEWESEAAIEAYRNSDAHKEIVRHTRGLKGAKAEVKLYSGAIGNEGGPGASPVPDSTWGALEFLEYPSSSDRGGGLSLQNLYFFLQNQL